MKNHIIIFLYFYETTVYLRLLFAFFSLMDMDFHSFYARAIEMNYFFVVQHKLKNISNFSYSLKFLESNQLHYWQNLMGIHFDN